MTSITSHRADSLTGTTRVPGDKSISHRALILGALAVGETPITGISRGEDVGRTAAALRHLGAEILPAADDVCLVHGCGVGGLCEPASILDLGNSGTGSRLLMGVAATQELTAHFTGDASLSSRPMNRVIVPLVRMGAAVDARDGGRLPLVVHGTATPVPIEYPLPVPSAQVKSAVLLAGLNTPGKTTVIEHTPTRDHTERMLAYFNGDIAWDEHEDGSRGISVRGEVELTARPVTVPGDPSAAAFLVAAALSVPDSDITIENVGTNPLRTGFIKTLMDMDADITMTNARVENGEPLSDIRVRYGTLTGIEVPPERAPTMIDEYPVLAALAATAEGETVMRGVRELRVKESDRISAMAEGMIACGVTVETFEDGLSVTGTGGSVRGGATVATYLDHRIAMSFLVLGMTSRESISIDDAVTIDTSFPGFADTMKGLGADITSAITSTAAAKK